jgi:hypothetical protein
VIERLKRSNFSPEITSFLGSMFGVVLKSGVLLMAAGKAGFDTSALLGILAAGFAVSLALQDGLGKSLRINGNSILSPIIWKLSAFFQFNKF